MIVNAPIIGWRVRACDEQGVVLHEQDFWLRPGFDAKKAALRHAQRMPALFPGASVSVADLDWSDAKK